VEALSSRAERGTGGGMPARRPNSPCMEPKASEDYGR
jgi:hypothetical protein